MRKLQSKPPPMQTLPILILFLLIMAGCGQNASYQEHAASDFFSNNEDKFGFLIFGKQKIDSFFKEYPTLDFNNAKIKNRLRKLIVDDTIPKAINNFKSHTSEPTLSDFNLASNVIKAAISDSGHKYFDASVNYLFFYECLPDQFTNKWTQTRLGDFKFNVTFFNLMRTKCKIFDDHIYGNSGHWDDKIRKVFKADSFNEITSDKANEIKNCIVSETSFEDNRLLQDKTLFIAILDSVLEKKWRVLILDKN